MSTFLSTVAMVAIAMGTAAGTALAESGSDRLLESHMRQEARVAQEAERDSANRYAQMIEEQPTAAGPVLDAQAPLKTEPRYSTPIERDRALYGTPK